MRTGRWGLLFAVVLVGCSSGSSDGGGGGNCPDYSGSWSLSGTCLDTACTISQNGCSFSMSCSPSGATYQGSINGGSITFGDGSDSCSGSLGTKSASGSCNTSLGTCQWNAACQSGACGTVASGGGGGGGGSGGSSGVDCNSSCQILTSCCTAMPMSDCLEGCNGSPSTNPACIACFQNPSCGSLTPCVIANCQVPSELCPN